MSYRGAAAGSMEHKAQHTWTGVWEDFEISLCIWRSDEGTECFSYMGKVKLSPCSSHTLVFYQKV